MREHGLQPRIRRRYVATTDSDHDQPIFPNRTTDVIVDRPDRLWVVDITYVEIAVGFVYVAGSSTPGRAASSAMRSGAPSTLG
jgi:putative transposase